jgi:uncharacterized membrane protein
MMDLPRPDFMEAVAVLLLLATALFSLSLVAVPLAMEEGNGLAPGADGHGVVIATMPIDRCASLLYDIGGLICHQSADRSYFPGGSQMPVCERCFGIFLGMTLAFGAAAVVRPKGGFFSYLTEFFPASLRGSGHIRIVILLAGAALCTPLVLDGSLQLFTAYESTPAVRTITGILYGIAKAGLLLGILAEMNLRADRYFRQKMPEKECS